MRAKCKICKESVDTTTAYKIITYDKNNKAKVAYYCSKEEYEKNEAYKNKTAADKDRVYRLICDIMSRNEITNSILWKEKAIWNQVATDETIWKYLEENKAYLTSVIEKLEDKEFNRIRYLSAILKNSLGDFKPKEVINQAYQPKICEEHYETKFNPKKRIGLEDLEDEYFG